MSGDSGTRTACTEAEWVLRQGFACVSVKARSPEAAIEIAAKRLGHMGGWKVGPDVNQEVFAAEEYREHAKPGGLHAVGDRETAFALKIALSEEEEGTCPEHRTGKAAANAGRSGTGSFEPRSRSTPVTA